MAREIQIVTWCDQCLAEGQQVDASERAGLSSSGARVTVDLCDDHAEEYLALALSVFDTYGRTEAKAPRAPRRASAAAPGPCPECEKEFPSPQSLGMHRWRKHGVPSQHRNKREAA